MNQRTEYTLLAAIVITFFLLGTVYSIVTPVFEASDEKWHYPMVKYIADNWGLPTQDPEGEETPWRQEGSQAPLYYALSAAATFWIDTSDMHSVRQINPHAADGPSPDGNVNLVVHDPVLERFPWRGTVLAVHIIRFLSVGMSAAAVAVTYFITREVLPGRPALALGAAAIHAFTPMFVFISGSVNNDNLAVLLAGLGLWMLVRKSAKSQVASGKVMGLVREYLPLGIVLGLAALTKSQTLALAPITALVIIVRAIRRRSWREFLIGGFATALPLLIIAGWWYLRNWQLYGDLTGLSAFKLILGTRDVPADLSQLWRERFSFLAGYWGNFGGLNVPMAAWTYKVLNAMLIIAGFGVVIAMLKRQEARGKRHVARGKRQEATCNLQPTSCFLPPASCFLPPAPCLLPLASCLLWALLVFASWAWWARETWSSQGRLVFYAIPVWSLLLAMGLAGWLPRRWGRWAVAAFALFLLGLAIVAPFAWIAPAYALPEPLTDAQIVAIANPLDATFGDALTLLGYDLETPSVEPGGQVELTLYWEALAATEQEYIVFVHLLGKEDRPIAQRDTFPGLGLLSTTRLEPGFRWADQYVIQVPHTTYTPDEAEIAVGLYNAGGRLVTRDGADSARFGQIEIHALPGDVPNPISINFGDRMELVGYDLDRLAARPEEQITLALHWRGLGEMEHNYSISAQLVGDDLAKVAEDSNWPLGGNAPTMLWNAQTLLEDPKTLVVHPDAAPGVYDVQIAVFRQDDQGIVHLPMISEREMPATYVVLTRVRVEP